MLHRTSCGCEKDIGMTQARAAHTCEHGNVYVYVKRLGTRAERAGRSPRRRLSKAPERDWTAARAKVEEEGCCRICKRTDRKLEAAHILGREHDEPKTRIDAGTGELIATKVLWVDPLRIFPACGPFPDGCHGDADYRRINILPHLTLEEQIQAVKDAGGIEAARIRLAPVEHREEVEASAA